MEFGVRGDGALQDHERDSWIAAEYARRLTQDAGDPTRVYLDVVAAWEVRRQGEPPLRKRRRWAAAGARTAHGPRTGQDASATDETRRPGLAGLASGRLPVTLFEAARRSRPGNDHDEDAAHDQLLAGLRRALGRAVRAGAADDDLFGGALASNDQRRAGEEADALARPPAAMVSPAAAYVGLAAQVAVAAVQRSLTTAPARLAARVQDGGEELSQLDDRPDLLTALAAAAKDAGEPLAPTLRAQLEGELGHGFGHVRVHTGTAATAAARAINARAFTLGDHVYFADGELAPNSEAGLALLRHELTHVIQHDHGRLRSSGGLEVAAHDGAEEREARAAETAPGHPPTATPTSAPHRAAPSGATAAAPPTSGVVGRGIVDRVTNAVGGAIGDLASMGEDMFLSVVRRISPQLADLLERGPAALVGAGVRDAVAAMLGSLIPANPLAPLLSFGAGILDVAGTLIGAAAGDTKCCETFANWCTKLGAFARKAASSDAVKKFKAAFAALDSALGLVVRVFGFGVTEALRGQLQFLSTMGSWITDAIAAVARVAQRIADWVLRQLGWPSVAQIGTMLQTLAEQAWQAIKDLAAAGIAKLRELGPALLAISGLGPLVEALRFSFELIEVTDWLIQHRSDPNLVRTAREQMAHTFLPRLLEKMGGLVGKIQSAVAWVESHLTEVIAALVGVSLVLTGVLAPLGLAVLGAIAVLRQVWPMIKPAFEQLKQALAALWQRFLTFSNPVIDTFVQLGTAISQPWMLPAMLASSAWLLLPECFKGPILDLMLELLIAAIAIMPDSVALFGPLWRYMKAGALGFLREVRDSWSQPDKIRVVNRIARMGSGRSLQMMTGFVVGFGKGVVAGVLDPFKMVYDLLKIGWDLTVFLAKLANQSPEVAAAVNRHLPQLQQHARHIMDAGRQALDDFLHGKITFEDVWRLMTSFADSLEAQATQLGITGAQRIKNWILAADTEYSIGEAIGTAIGFIIVFALIVYFSGGAFAEAKGVIGAVAQVARILNMPYELLGAALKPLATLFGPVLRGLAVIGERLGLKAVWEGAMRAFEGFVNTLGRLVEDILIAIERRVVERTVEVIASELARHLGADIARRLIADLTAQGVERLVERLGEDVVRRLGRTLSGHAIEQLGERLGRPLLERMLSSGLTPAAIERLGLTFERATVEALLNRGLTAAQLERLGALSAARLQGLTVDHLGRLGTLPEASFNRLTTLSDSGFRRMAGLTEAQLDRYLALGNEQLRMFAEMNDAAFRRFAALDDAAFNRFRAMAGPELQRFAALSDTAFDRFATLDAATFDRFRALSPEALERFGNLGDGAFRRFAALDATTLAKFEGISAAALERYGTMAGGFDRFANASRATVEKFAALSDGAFQRFATAADGVFLKFEGLAPDALERFGSITEPAFTRFAALDSPVIARFGNVPVAGLERFGTMADPAAFARFAGLDAAGLERFAAINQAAFDEFARVAYSAAEMTKLSGLSVQALEHLGEFGLINPGRFNFLTRRISQTGLERLGELSGAEIEGLVTGLGPNPARIEMFATLDAATLREFAQLPAPVLTRYAALTSAELQGFQCLTRGEMEFFAQAPGDLARFGAINNPAALRNFAAAPAALQREVFLLDNAACRRVLNLPPGDLAKLHGMTGMNLQQLAGRADFEALVAANDAAALAHLAGDDAAGRAAATANAAALDTPLLGGHPHVAHGAQTRLPGSASTGGAMSAVEERLTTGRRPDGLIETPPPTHVSAFASDAAQNEAARLGHLQLNGEIAAHPGQAHFDLDVTLSGAGYRYHLDGAGRMVEEQVGRVRIGYHLRPGATGAGGAGDYYIVTMFPQP